MNSIRSERVYIIYPVVSMRKDPSEKSEVVSQALFNEHVFFFEQEKQWSRIATPDGYSGWVLSSPSLGVFKEYFPTHHVCRLSTPVYEEKSIKTGPCMLLPFGVKLEVVGKEDSWDVVRFPSDKVCFIQNGNLEPARV